MSQLKQKSIHRIYHLWLVFSNRELQDETRKLEGGEITNGNPMRYLVCVESACSQRPPFFFWNSPQYIQGTATALSFGSSHKTVSWKPWCWLFYALINVCAVLMCAKHLANHRDLCWFRPEGGHGPLYPIPPWSTVFHYNPAWKNTRL